jgi:hypothetical protein
MDNKYPKEYVLMVKRNLTWNERRIILSETTMKYINPSNLILKIEERENCFEAKLSDCIMTVEKNGYTLNIVSRTKMFKDMRIRHAKGEYLKKFKIDFENLAKGLTNSEILNQFTTINHKENLDQSKIICENEDKSLIFETVENCDDHKISVEEEIQFKNNCSKNIPEMEKRVSNLDFETDCLNTVQGKITETGINQKTVKFENFVNFLKEDQKYFF